MYIISLSSWIWLDEYMDVDIGVDFGILVWLSAGEIGM
jgi:hypothetical protein